MLKAELEKELVTVRKSIAEQSKRINKLVPMAANFDRVNKEHDDLEQKSIVEGGKHYRTKANLEKSIAENASLELEIKAIKDNIKEARIVIESICAITYPNLDLEDIDEMVYRSNGEAFNTIKVSYGDLTPHERSMKYLYEILNK